MASKSTAGLKRRGLANTPAALSRLQLHQSHTAKMFWWQVNANTKTVTVRTVSPLSTSSSSGPRHSPRPCTGRTRWIVRHSRWQCAQCLCVRTHAREGRGGGPGEPERTREPKREPKREQYGGAETSARPLG